MKIEHAASPSARSAPVLGVEISLFDMEETLAFIDSRIASRAPSLIVTADATGLMIARRDPEFAQILRNAALVTPDSAGVIWALRRQGLSALRVSGVDLVDRLCARSADHGYRIYFLGAAPGVAERAAERMRLRHPGCNIVGARHGYFPPESDEVVAQEITQSKPDILFVAMGMPRQEKFILKTQSIIGASVAMGVGGSFDVFSGKTKRAPILVQKLHAEWLWRLLLNPKKFQKVRELPGFVRAVLSAKK